MQVIRDDEFKLFQSYFVNTWGIVIPDNKRYLFNLRLSGILAKNKLRDFSGLYFKLTCLNDEELKRRLINAMTTRETSFFRDSHYYDTLKKRVIPDIIDNHLRVAPNIPKIIRILSAGCSTGEEVYSIAFIVKEITGQKKEIAFNNFRIIGIDVSSDAISKARNGEYAERSLDKRVPTETKNKYFVKSKNNLWSVIDDVKQSISFFSKSLAEPLYTLGFFDLILCRNTLIYFSNGVRQSALMEFKRMLLPNGVLMVGSSESLHDVCNHFTPIHSSGAIYYVVKK